MKQVYTFILLFTSTLGSGQNLEVGKLWRTHGVYDSLGNFIERAKVQNFLYSASSKQFQRIKTVDRVNMNTGVVKIFVYRDTFNLINNGSTAYPIYDDEILTFHTKDSLTIQYKSYYTSYVKQNILPSEPTQEAFKAKLLKEAWSVSYKPEYDYTHKMVYQNNGQVEITSSSSNTPWKTEYKIIDFNGYLILQGITSAPKIINRMDENTIYFTAFDYRYPEYKMGTMYIDTGR